MFNKELSKVKTLKVGHTKSRIVPLKGLCKKYNVGVKFNSWKDGDIEVDIKDSNGVTLNLLYVKGDRNILSKLYKAVDKIINSNIICVKSYNGMRVLKKEVKIALGHATKMQGNLTHDYHEYDCHSKLNFISVG